MFCISITAWGVAVAESLEHVVRDHWEVFMRIVIVSDVHANLAALTALPEKHYDQLWCVGDVVDYGPKPHEVIQWIRQQAAVIVRGNPRIGMLSSSLDDGDGSSGPKRSRPGTAESSCQSAGENRGRPAAVCPQARRASPPFDQ